MSGHDAVVEWRGPGEADVLSGFYSREHVIRLDGGVVIPGSASPSVVRAPWSAEAAADPEELLVAAASACHMLVFIDLARHAGFAVLGYRDAAQGRMGKVGEGRFGLTRIALRPAVEWPPGKAPTQAQLDDLHHRAHLGCFIANSLIAEITIEPPGPLAAAGAQGAAAHA